MKTRLHVVMKRSLLSLLFGSMACFALALSVTAEGVDDVEVCNPCDHEAHSGEDCPLLP